MLFDRFKETKNSKISLEKSTGPSRREPVPRGEIPHKNITKFQIFKEANKILFTWVDLTIGFD